MNKLVREWYLQQLETIAGPNLIVFQITFAYKLPRDIPSKEVTNRSTNQIL